MRYLALATDYDGTLASDGRVAAGTVTALERLVETGRKLILVTGREPEDLRRAFDRLDLFDLAVVENGAVLYNPARDRVVPLAEPPPAEFVDALRDRGVHPLSVGRVIVATWHPNENVVLDVIRELGLELELTFNKGAVMVLPAGVTKATGLHAALEELRLSSHNVVGIGDAENDHAFLTACECAVAVANALPALKQACDLVTDGARGAGVAQLADRLIADDLASLDDRLIRHDRTLGRRPDDAEVEVTASGPCGSGQ
jgi:HAD superfamily hydrolase (TIGR01484 family)